MQHTVIKDKIIKLNVDIEKVYEDIENNGFSLFPVGVINKEQFLEFCYNFGEVIPSGRGKTLVDEILINNGTGTEKLPFHTDKSYWRIPPRYEILYINDVDKMEFGEITISSIKKAFESLTPSEQEQLISLESKYSAPSNRDSGYNPMAKFVNIVDGKIEFFRYRLDIFSSDCEAIKKMSDIIEENHYKIKYNKGDILILDNWLYAAGRNITRWGENGFRHMFRTLII